MAYINPEAKIPKGRKLLFFGCDYLVVNVGNSSDRPASQILRLLDQFFGIGHDTDNACELNDVDLGGCLFNGFFVDTPKGQSLQLMYNNYKAIDIVRTEDSPWAQTINYKYCYRMSFYGAFFRLVEQKELDPAAIFESLFTDESTTYSVSRIDVAFDIANMTVRQIANTVPKYKGRKNNMFGVEEETGEIETYYVGRTDSSNSRHYVRIYDKLLEAVTKRKVSLHANYLDYKSVTRLELEVRAQSCSNFGVEPLHALSLSALFEIVRKVLQNRSTKWGIMKYLEKAVEKYELSPVELVPRIKNPEPLGRTEYFNRWYAMAITLYRDWGYDPVICLSHFLKEELGLEYRVTRKVENMEDWMKLFSDN